VTHINDLSFLGDAQVTLGIMSSCVAHWASYLTRTIPPSFLSILAGFNKKVMQVCGDIMGLGLWEFIQGPLVTCQTWLPISFVGTSVYQRYKT
jgi:hypothetical protein